MNESIHRHLDGEIPMEDLTAQEAAEARAWREWLDDYQLDRESAPPWIEGRIMAALPDGSPARVWQRAWRWLLRPRIVQVRPATLGLAAAAVLAALLVLPGGEPSTVLPGPNGPVENAGAAGAESHVYVRFELSAPGAASVSVAGDFNGWSTTSSLLRDTDADGVWTGIVPLTPGVHKYMFVVNGSRWITDPSAERYMDDGFGMRNALIAVSSPALWSSS